MVFFNPFDEIRITKNNMPHWQQPGATYFITFRMADALPAAALRGLKEERARWQQIHPPPLTAEEELEYHRLFSARVDQWLDAGHGACVLRQPALRSDVVDAMTYFDRDRYVLLSYVVMPNHVHALVTLHPEWLLEKVIFTWKRRTAGVLNEKLGMEGKFWQHDYFDRLIRDASHLSNVVRYIRRNPVKARLSPDQFTLWESELAQQVTG